MIPSRFAAVARPAASQTMPAVVYRQHGAADVLEYCPDYEKPIREHGQTLVRIHAAAVNPVDFKMREHRIPAVVYPLPKIPGTDIAGEVVNTDPESGFAVGDQVFGMMPLLGMPWGACAQYVSIAHRFLAKAPQSIDSIGAASLPLVSLTVIEGLMRAIEHSAASIGGRRILIQAGSGGLGTFAIQYCSRVLEMQVATTCGPGSMDLVRSLGAEVVINYHSERFEQQIRDYDFVFDPLGHRYAARTFNSGVLRRGGHYIHIAGSDWPPNRPGRFIPEASPLRLAANLTRQWWRNTTTRLGVGRIYYHLIFVHPSQRILQDVGRHVDQGKIVPIIDRTFPLSQTAAAQKYLEKGHARGKVVIVIDD
jgi:alcohol dehydrogenase